MKSKNWIWGVFFLLAAIFIIVNQLGYFTQVSLFSVIVTIFLIPVIILSIASRNFWGILFPLAGIGIIYAEPLGITNLTPWPILAVALFGSIGLSLMFGKKHHYNCYHSENFDQVINSPDDSVVNFSVSFGSAIKYVNTENFRKANVGCSFGALKVYFDNAQVPEEGAEITLDISFAGVELYVPRNWKVINEVNASLGGLEEKGKRNDIAEGNVSPTVVINGKISFSGVDIIYI